MPEQPLLELSHIAKSYAGRAVLHDVSLCVRAGECVALTGANGCGKSTLLRIAAELARPDAGLVRARGATQYVPEAFPRLDIRLDRLLRALEKIDCADTRALAVEFALEGALGLSVRDFSKGMLGKVAAIQALCADASVLLLDEPVSGQDAPSRRAFCRRVLEKKRRGAAVLMACHEKQLIDELADRTARIADGMIASDEPTCPDTCLCARCPRYLRGDCTGREALSHA